MRQVIDKPSGPVKRWYSIAQGQGLRSLHSALAAKLEQIRDDSASSIRH